jgi:DNA polymerase III subunit beta
MKFIASSGILTKKLSNISGIIGTSVTQPIIQNFKFNITKDNLRATATDSETTMSIDIPIQCNEEATICVENKLLLDYLKQLGEQPLAFDINTEDYSIEITSDEGKYKLVGENAIAYPAEPKSEGNKSFEIASVKLLNAVSNTVFAVSTDEQRLAMTGVYFEMQKNSLTLVATDAHRLVRHMLAGIDCGSINGIIVPRKGLQQVKNILPTDETKVSVSYDGNHIFFSKDDFQICCRLIDAKYPDYKVVIPNENPYELTANHGEFYSALRRVKVFASKSTKQIVLKISANELRMNAQDLDYSLEGNESMACQYNGEDMEIAFNGTLLEELVGVLKSEEIKIELSTPSRAGIIKPTDKADDEDILMLMMPLMLN